MSAASSSGAASETFVCRIVVHAPGAAHVAVTLDESEAPLRNDSARAVIHPGPHRLGWHAVGDPGALIAISAEVDGVRVAHVEQGIVSNGRSFGSLTFFVSGDSGHSHPPPPPPRWL